MKPIEVKLSLTKQQEEAAYIMERLDELATVLMDVYNGKEKLEAVETVASALHNNIRYKVGSLVTDGGRKRQTMTITVNDYRLSVGAAADKEIRHQVRALIRRYNTVNPFTLAALSGLTVQRVKLPAGIRGFSMQGGKIFLSRYLLPAQRRRTLAHELGHNIPGHLEQQRDLNIVEQEAQLFAYYLTGEFNRR